MKVITKDFITNVLEGQCGLCFHQIGRDCGI